MKGFDPISKGNEMGIRVRRWDFKILIMEKPVVVERGS